MSVSVKKLTRLVRHNRSFSRLECQRTIISAKGTKPWLYEVRLHAVRDGEGLLVGFRVKPLDRWVIVKLYHDDPVWGTVTKALDNVALVNNFFVLNVLCSAASESPGAFMKEWMNGV